MAANRSGLTLIDGSSVRYRFAIKRAGRGRGYTVKTKPFETTDPPQTRVRMPLHLFEAGLQPSRLVNSRGYADTSATAGMDASWEGELVPPPAYVTRTLTSALVAGTRYRMFNTGTASAPVLELFILADRFVYKVSSSMVVSTDKDFGASTHHGLDMEVFDGNLVVAMGETEKMYSRNAAGTWTQAADSTFAIALGVSRGKLFRAETTNLISSCLSGNNPLTLANWTPSTSATKYVVGNQGYPVHTLLDSRGALWAIKGDGAYQSDASYAFTNQSPQMYDAPHADNGKGAKALQGVIWIPWQRGLLRGDGINMVSIGPEIVNRPNWSYWIRGLVEIDGHLYLLATNDTNTSTAIVQMTPDYNNVSGNEYVYHEIMQFSSAVSGRLIALFTLPANPKLVFTGGAATSTLGFINLGKGGGRDIDDPVYAYGPAGSINTGNMKPTVTATLASAAHGPLFASLLEVEVLVNNTGANSAWTVGYRIDNPPGAAAAFTLMLDTQEGGGASAITTAGMSRARRFAATTATGTLFDFQLSWTGTTTLTGNTRPRLLEAWATFLLHPHVTDEITVNINADMMTREAGGGSRTGYSSAQMEKMFKNWIDDGTVLTMEMEGYEESTTTRVVVIDYQGQDSEVLGVVGGNSATVTKEIQVTFQRLDLAGGYAN